MRLDKTVLLAPPIALLAILSACTLSAQETGPGEPARLETSLGYTFLHANAPPGQCGCFSANGGFGSVVFNLPQGFGVVADVNFVHASNVSATAQSITVFNYLFGPRYSFRSASRRFVPYAQILGGGSRETSSYTAVQNVKGAAFSVGGGVNTILNRHVTWTIFEADWVHSYIPNAQNDLQNDLRISSGIGFRLGTH
jgi:hypothetical protein